MLVKIKDGYWVDSERIVSTYVDQFKDKFYPSFRLNDGIAICGPIFGTLNEAEEFINQVCFMIKTEASKNGRDRLAAALE